VEFRNKKIAQKVHEKRQGAKIQGRVLIVDTVGKPNVPKANADSNKTKGKSLIAGMILKFSYTFMFLLCTLAYDLLLKIFSSFSQLKLLQITPYF